MLVNAEYPPPEHILRHMPDTEPDVRRSNGIAKLAGGWNEAEFLEFECNTAVFREMDSDLWK